MQQTVRIKAGHPAGTPSFGILGNSAELSGLPRGFQLVWLYDRIGHAAASHIHGYQLSQSWKAEWCCIFKWIIRGVFPLLASSPLIALTRNSHAHSAYFRSSPCFFRFSFFSTQSRLFQVVLPSLAGQICSKRGGLLQRGATHLFSFDCSPLYVK